MWSAFKWNCRGQRANNRLESAWNDTTDDRPHTLTSVDDAVAAAAIAITVNVMSLIGLYVTTTCRFIADLLVLSEEKRPETC